MFALSEMRRNGRTPPSCDLKRRAKMFAMRGVQRAVAKSVIRAFKSDDARLAGGEHGGFQRGFHRFKAGVAENGFAARFATFQRSKVMRLSSRASCAFSACGCTSPMACSSFAICLWPARDDARIGMAGGGDAERRGQIEIFCPSRPRRARRARVPRRSARSRPAR